MANQAMTVFSWSTNFSPETSTTILSMVPPVNANGAVYSGVTGDALSRPTQMPSPTRQKFPGWVMISPSPTFSASASSVRGVDLDARGNGVRAAVDRDTGCLGDVSDVRIVGVLLTVRCPVRAFGE